jgi:hypothetical protein
MTAPTRLADLADRLGAEFPAGLTRVWNNPRPIGWRLYDPGAPSDDPNSLDAALRVLASAAQTPPPGLVPISYVDDRSFACVVCRPVNGEPFRPVGQVVRWHLDDIPAAHQGALLDIDPESYVESLGEELGAAWQRGYEGMAKVSSTYQAEFIGKGVTPKAHNLRPFQLACQNVIIGLAAMRQDAVIDGLSVEYWQTCEVPHVATNEGNRALSALMLCDAFQSGGTMEISFASHPERKVPASLRRYGRTLGVSLGEKLPGGSSISPCEARELFRAVTPMTEGLREVVDATVGAGLISVERLCYSLLSPIWPAIELEFILRCSNRAGSILEGGADIEDRAARTAELEISRAASMVGTLLRRLDNKDGVASVGNGTTRVFEDTSNGVTWTVVGESGAVEFRGIPPGVLPWQDEQGELIETFDGTLVAVPRAHPVADDIDSMESILGDAPRALIVPRGSVVPGDVPILCCPDRLADIDARVLRNLETSALMRV